MLIGNLYSDLKMLFAHYTDDDTEVQQCDLPKVTWLEIAPFMFLEGESIWRARQRCRCSGHDLSTQQLPAVLHLPHGSQFRPGDTFASAG